MSNLLRDMREVLTLGGTETGEARAVAMLLLERVAGLTTAEVLMGTSVAPQLQEQLMRMAARVAEGEPVQYVMGEAEFCGQWLHVEPGVLIPRKETEELVNWMVEDATALGQVQGALHVLDIGTGSGCIAVTLAHLLPQAEVEAWDVSETALRIARANAQNCGVKVNMRQVDVLKQGEDTELAGGLDLLVSNPPYICQSEALSMERNVLDHEPELALFVPDDDPLLFYRRIAQLGQTLLKKGGRLFFEINRQYGQATVSMLKDMGYEEVALRKDQFDNDRMVRAVWKQ